MTNHIAVQITPSSYEVWAFASEAHARAYMAVKHISGARPTSNAYGRRLLDRDLTGYLGEAVESLALTIECGEGDATPTTPGGRRIDGTYTTSVPVSVNCRTEQRTYTVGRVVKTLRTGQPIGLLNQQSVVPATVIRLGYNSVIVSVNNGGRRPRELTIDCSTTGTINSLTAIVSAPSTV